MASKYWIKLYHEILHDPKMGKMTDKLWRRCIELFLLAGEFDQDGLLPSVEEIAWTLRVDEAECNETLQQLQRLNVAHCNDDETWTITHFTERQDASTSTERSRAHRDRKRQEKVLEPLRNAQRNVAPDTDTDKEESSPNGEGGKPPRQNKMPAPIQAVKIHVEVTGKYLLNKAQERVLKEVVGDSPNNLEKWRNTVTAWVMAGHKPHNISGMLDWFRNGIPVFRQNGVINGAHKPTNTTTASKNRKLVDLKTGREYWVDQYGKEIPAPV